MFQYHDAEQMSVSNILMIEVEFLQIPCFEIFRFLCMNVGVYVYILYVFSLTYFEC